MEKDPHLCARAEDNAKCRADTFPALSSGLGKHLAIARPKRGTKFRALFHLFIYLFVATDHQAIPSSAEIPWASSVTLFVDLIKLYGLNAICSGFSQLPLAINC